MNEDRKKRNPLEYEIITTRIWDERGFSIDRKFFLRALVPELGKPSHLIVSVAATIEDYFEICLYEYTNPTDKCNHSDAWSKFDWLSFDGELLPPDDQSMVLFNARNPFFDPEYGLKFIQYIEGRAAFRSPQLVEQIKQVACEEFSFIQRKDIEALITLLANYTDRSPDEFGLLCLAICVMYQFVIPHRLSYAISYLITNTI